MPSGKPWRIDRAGYDRLLSLPNSGWGWEFKRRDPALHDAYRRAGRRQLFRGRREDGAMIVRLNQRCFIAEEHGLHFLPNPALSALETTPFWLPEVLSASFDATFEIEKRVCASRERFRWDELPGDKHILIAPGRRQKLLIEAPGYAAQLALDGAGLPVPQAVYFSLKLGAGALVGKNLRHVEDFARLCVGLSPCCKPLRGMSPEKLRDAIIALDGALANIPRRAIAEAIFGENNIGDSWDEGDESYKKRTKRLVEKGFELMRAGYRKLL